MNAAGGLLARLRQPEYTGENRCLPCTAVNTLVAAVMGIAVGAAVAAASATAVGVATGLGVFGLGLAAIYLRGYLVPGTPELTKRYLPGRVLELFGKAPPGDTGHADPGPDGVVDPETELTAVGAVEECPEGEDLCLTDSFRDEWESAIDGLGGEDVDRSRLLDVLDVDEAEVTYEEHGDAFVARIEGRTAGKWESHGAFLADLGAAQVLERRHPDWGRLGVQERSQLLNGLRLFIETCPTCGGTPEFGIETVTSCCSGRRVAAVSCGNCGTRLFESTPI